MSCDQIKPMLHTYLDRELSDDEMLQVADHVRTCASCREDLQVIEQISAVWREQNLKHDAPPQLQQAISDRLKQADRESRASYSQPALWWASVPALIVGIVLGVLLMNYDKEQQLQNQMVQTVASAHVRSLMVDHATDVASSDSHTVKPWFHGRLDFSPEAKDLSAQGYPLLGGRLDYLAGRSVAALVYRHRKHEINLFIMPRLTTNTAALTAVYHGYNILHWNDTQFDYWAVSDLNTADLKHFKELL